jgi:hypothetical protein
LQCKIEVAFQDTRALAVQLLVHKYTKLLQIWKETILETASHGGENTLLPDLFGVEAIPVNNVSFQPPSEYPSTCRAQ